MASRRRRSVRVRRGKRNLAWVTTIVQASITDGTLGVDVGELVVPSDWTGIGSFDRCTLLSIRGWYHIANVTTSTPTDIVMMAGAIYKTSAQVAAGVFDPYDAAAYVEHDVLYTLGALSGATVWVNPQQELEVATKRRLTSGDEIRLGVSVATDTVLTARMNIAGVFRMLLDLD